MSSDATDNTMRAELNAETEALMIRPWKYLGEVFGFPECCIEEFCLSTLDRPIRKLDGTGYVPCWLCNQKSEVGLIAAIVVRRDARLRPFPNDRGPFVKDLLKQAYGTPSQWSKPDRALSESHP